MGNIGFTLISLAKCPSKNFATDAVLQMEKIIHDIVHFATKLFIDTIHVQISTSPYGL